jgi:hypothetical protein
MSRKRNISEVQVSATDEVLDEKLCLLRCTLLVHSLVQPDHSKWRLAKYSDIVYTFQRVQTMILHMDEPSVSNFDAWFAKLFDGEEETIAEDMGKNIKTIANGTKIELKGWNDLFAAYCMMDGAFGMSDYKNAIRNALKVELDFHHDSSRAICINFNNTMKQIEDKYQIRAVNKFFDAIKAKDPKLAIRMKRSLEYPPRVQPKVQTKEERQHLEALELVREEIDDEEF